VENVGRYQNHGKHVRQDVPCGQRCITVRGGPFYGGCSSTAREHSLIESTMISAPSSLIPDHQPTRVWSRMGGKVLQDGNEARCAPPGPSAFFSSPRRCCKDSEDVVYHLIAVQALDRDFRRIRFTQPPERVTFRERQLDRLGFEGPTVPAGDGSRRGVGVDECGGRCQVDRRIVVDRDAVGGPDLGMPRPKRAKCRETEVECGQASVTAAEQAGRAFHTSGDMMPAREWGSPSPPPPTQDWRR